MRLGRARFVTRATRRGCCTRPRVVLGSTGFPPVSTALDCGWPASTQHRPRLHARSGRLPLPQTDPPEKNKPSSIPRDRRLVERDNDQGNRLAAAVAGTSGSGQQGCGVCPSDLPWVLAARGSSRDCFLLLHCRGTPPGTSSQIPSVKTPRSN